MATYVVSDLHGQYEAFEAGLKKIEFNGKDELYVIGDAIDRGSGGIKILQHVKQEKNMDLIIGNHEFMMLNAVDPNGKPECNGQDDVLWLYYNGGNATFAEYKKLHGQTRKSLLLWLNRRYLIKTLEVNGKKFCLTHSYYAEECENKQYFELSYRDVWHIVWKSQFRHDAETRGFDIYKDYDYTFITGHVPVMSIMRDYNKPDFNELRIYEKGNLIDIDGACGLGYHPGLHNGALFLRLDDMKVFPVLLESIEKEKEKIDE